MPRIRPHFVIAALLLAAIPANAGQVRITLGGMTFTPSSPTINAGDQVVWIWANGSHTVTSGPDGEADGVFDSGGQGGGIPTLSGAGTQFSWKSGAAGDQPYFCSEHYVYGMFGTLHISSGQPVADFRITEVQYNAASNGDRIEIANLGNATGDLGRYRISISNTASEQDILPMASLLVPPGGRVTIMTNQSGSSTSTLLFVPGIGNLPSTGSASLFVPYRLDAATPGLLGPDLMVDFVQWTAAGQPNEATAIAASLWPNGDYVPGDSDPAHSISFCGSAANHGAPSWHVSTPNFGSDDPGCATPTTRSSWGRIKSIYR